MNIRRPIASLRTFLVVLILIASVPIALVMSLQVVESARAETRRVQHSLDAGASSVARQIDADLRAHVEGLHLLAPRHLDDDAAARAWSRRLVEEGRRLPGWLALALVDRGGEHVGAARTRASGAAGPDPARPGLATVLEGATLSGPAAMAEGEGQRASEISVPIAGSGGYRLVAWVDPQAWRAQLVAASLPLHAVATLYDDARTPVARSGALPADGDGLRFSASRDLSIGGWRVAVELPAAALESAQRRSMLLALGTVAACLLVGVSLALWFARRVVRPLGALGANGATPAEVHEIAALQEAHADAARNESAARERLQAQADEFLESERRLRETQKLIELAQSAGRVAFFRYVIQTDRVHPLPGYGELFGTDVDGEPEPLERWLQRVHADERDSVHRCLRSLAEGREGHGQVTFRVADGPRARRWMSVRLVVGPDRDGGERQVLGVAVDVTEQKQAEEERAARMADERAARQEAEAANRAKDEFLAMLGHELRNPLNAIASAVQVMKLGAPAVGARGDDARAIIERQTRHLAHLMDDLLDMARVASGKVLLDRRPLDLGQLARSVVDTMRVAGEFGSHRLTVEADEAWVDADAIRLEQVASNLIANAVRYTPADGSIEVTVRVAGEHAVLEVRDDGPGIAPSLLEQVFEPFVQGPRPLDRRAGGLGIGLSLVRRLVQLHGGTVEVESPGRGSCFRVALPRVRAPLPVPDDRRARARQPRSVLLVEDNEDAVQALRLALELDGHDVEVATDGRSGLDQLLERRPEFALVDIGLPLLDGYELARQSRRAGYAGRLIALTGYGLEENVRASLRAGFDEHLSKPVDFDRLRELMQAA